MIKSLSTVLTIGGSDPTCGAGIQADIRSISVVGCHPLAVITSITSQNSKGVQRVFALPPDLIFDQICSIQEDVLPDSIKIGLLGSLDIAKEISQYLKDTQPYIPVVVDPVISSSAGGNMLEKDTSRKKLLEKYIKDIFPYSTVITPNYNEAKELVDIFKLGNSSDMNKEEMADLIATESKCFAVIIKGGHDNGENAEDLLFINEKKRVVDISINKKQDCINLHGTGCVYSSILASYLAFGNTLQESFKMTSAMMSGIISKSINYKLGASTYGPLNINKYILK